MAVATCAPCEGENRENESWWARETRLAAEDEDEDEDEDEEEDTPIYLEFKTRDVYTNQVHVVKLDKDWHGVSISNHYGLGADAEDVAREYVNDCIVCLRPGENPREFVALIGDGFNTNIP